MDFFDDHINFDSAVQNLIQIRNDMQPKYNKNRNIFIMVFILLSIFGVYLFVSNGAKVGFLLFPILSGVFAIFLTIVITNATLRYKLAKYHINKEIVEIYNYTNGINVRYEAKPDIDKKFNTNMAIFNRYATANIKYMLSSDDLAMFEYNILQTTLVTSNGNSSTTHFDGYYIIFNIPTSQDFHIKYKNQRTNRKGQKFYRIDDPEHKIFLTADDYDHERNTVTRPLNNSFIIMYEKAKEIFKTEKISMGSDKHQIHFAVSKKLKTKGFKQIDEMSLRNYYNQFTTIIEETIEMAQYIDEQDLSY